MLVEYLYIIYGITKYNIEQYNLLYDGHVVWLCIPNNIYNDMVLYIYIYLCILLYHCKLYNIYILELKYGTWNLWQGIKNKNKIFIDKIKIKVERKVWNKMIFF